MEAEKVLWGSKKGSRFNYTVIVLSLSVFKKIYIYGIYKNMKMNALK